jgi:hypothetical protein
MEDSGLFRRHGDLGDFRHIHPRIKRVIAAIVHDIHVDVFRQHLDHVAHQRMSRIDRPHRIQQIGVRLHRRVALLLERRRHFARRSRHRDRVAGRLRDELHLRPRVHNERLRPFVAVLGIQRAQPALNLADRHFGARPQHRDDLAQHLLLIVHFV